MNPLPYMVPSGPQTHITEAYVSSPPALVIVDEAGSIFTLAPNRRGVIGGRFVFDVLRNGQPTGAIASVVERRGGRIRAFCADGWKRWNGNSFI